MYLPLEEVPDDAFAGRDLARALYERVLMTYRQYHNRVRCGQENCIYQDNLERQATGVASELEMRAIVDNSFRHLKVLAWNLSDLARVKAEAQRSKDLDLYNDCDVLSKLHSACRSHIERFHGQS